METKEENKENISFSELNEILNDNLHISVKRALKSIKEEEEFAQKMQQEEDKKNKIEQRITDLEYSILYVFLFLILMMIISRTT